MLAKRVDRERQFAGRLKPGVDRWSTDEEVKLTHMVEGSIAVSVRWAKVAKKLAGRSAAQCEAKWMEILKRDSNKGNWTDEEDRILRQWVGYGLILGV